MLPLSPAGLARYRQGELLNRVVADVDTLDHLYLRVISPLVGAFVVIMVVTIGLSFLDFTLAFTLGGIMLLTLFLMPPLFYRAGKSTGQNLTHLRGQYRQQLTAWLQGQAELTIFGASDRYRTQLENTEIQWLEAQRRQSELTALSQAIMLLIGALAVILMLWMASGGVGGNAQPFRLFSCQPANHYQYGSHRSFRIVFQRSAGHKAEKQRGRKSTGQPDKSLSI